MHPIQDELEGGRSVLAFDLRVLRWLLWDVNEGLSVVIESILSGLRISLLLILVKEIVPQSVFVVSMTAVHLESDAFVYKHLVLTLAWELEAFVGEHDVLPDLWDLDLLHFKEFFGVIVLVPLEAIEFTELESEQKELVWILNQVVENVYDFESHLLDLNAFRFRLVVFGIKLINLVLSLDECLQQLWDLSTLESVIHLRELVELEFLKLIEVLIALGRLDNLDVGQNKVVEKCKLLLDIWHKLVH